MRRRNLLPALTLLRCCLVLLSLLAVPVSAQQAIPPEIVKLVADLRSSDIGTRSSAAYRLGGLGSVASSAVPALAFALKDPDSTVQGYVANALGQIGPAANSAVPALITALKDIHANVRGAAAQALGQIGPTASSAIPTLTSLLNDNSSEVCGSAALALGKMGSIPTPDLKALRYALTHKSNDVRVYAEYGLGLLYAEDAFDVIALLDAQHDRPSAYCIPPDGDRVPTSVAGVINDMIVALKSSDKNDHSYGSVALEKITKELENQAKQISYADRDALIDQLNTAQNHLEAKPDEQLKIHGAILFLKEQQQHSHVRERILLSMSNKEVFADYFFLIAKIIIIIASANFLLLAFWPRCLVTINNVQKKVSGGNLPEPFNFLYLFISIVSGVGFFCNHKRVLDAWVENYAGEARGKLGKRPMFREQDVLLAPCRSELEKLTRAELRNRINKRLSLDEVELVWHDTFGDALKEQLPGQSKANCILGMITRAEQRGLMQTLLTNLCHYPHVANP